jgi:transcription antitermination factor NusG
MTNAMTPELMPSATQSHLEWLAVHTWSRHEKFVSVQLRNKEIETFLPLYPSPKKWKNRMAAADLPLFSGYLFVRIADHHRLAVLQTPGVSKFIGFQNRPAVIPNEEIAQLEIAVKGGMLAPHPFLNVGDRVRVQSGALEGLTGILVRDKKGERVVLSVELLSRSISVELDSVDVEPI